MTHKNKSKFVVLTGKGLILTLALNLLLTNSIMAGEIAGLGKKGPSTKTLRSMARVYMAYGEYTKAQPLAEQALTLAKRKDTSNSELAMCLIDLATLYNYQGKLAEAEKMCKLGMQLQEKVLYENHPYVAYTLRTLSSIYQGQGRYKEARVLYGEIVTAMIRVKIEAEAVVKDQMEREGDAEEEVQNADGRKKLMADEGGRV